MHEDIRRIIHADRDALDSIERRELEQHLSNCAECRSYIAELNTFGKTLRRAMHMRWDAARPAADLERDVRAQLGIERQSLPARLLNAALTLIAVIVFIFVLRALFDTQSQPVLGDSPLATPTPIASETPVDAIEVIDISFQPDPSTTLDPLAGFEFGASITLNSSNDFIANIVAFPLLPGETLAECNDRSIPTDRIFWSDQSEFAAGQHTYGQSFTYSDVADADRLVARVNVIKPDGDGSLLYCMQQVYSLSASTPTPTSTSLASATFTSSPTPRATPTPPTIIPTVTRTPFVPPPPTPTRTPFVPPPPTSTPTPHIPGDGTPTPPPFPTFTFTPYVATPTETARPSPPDSTPPPPFPSATPTPAPLPTFTPTSELDVPTSTDTSIATP